MLKRVLAVPISAAWLALNEAGRAARGLIGKPVPPSYIAFFYHSIPARDRTRFAEQLDYLAKATLPVPLGFRGPYEAGRRYSAVTLDDAFSSALANGVPELVARGIPFAVFVPTGDMGSNPRWRFNPGDTDRYETVASAEELRGISGELVTFGSHTIGHPRLSRLDLDAAYEEIAGSKRILEETLGCPVSCFAFPYGDHDDGLVEMCREAGYEMVFTGLFESAYLPPERFARCRTEAKTSDWMIEFRLKALGGYAWMAHASRARRRLQGARRAIVPGTAEPGGTGAVVRQATPGDRDAIWEFIERAYEAEEEGTARHKIPERWEWQFVRNPFIRGDGGTLPIWIGVKDGRVVGQQCSMEVEVEIEGRKYDASWSCDTIVGREARGEGVATGMTEAYYAHYPVSMAISMASISRNVWEKYGTGLAQVDRYHYYVRLDRDTVRRYLLRRSRRKPRLNRAITLACGLRADALVAAVANALSTVLRGLRPALRRDPVSDIEELSGFGPEFDELSERARGDYRAVVPRTSEFLGWRFTDNTQFDFHVFAARRAGELRGYVVVRDPHPDELPVGIISDFFVAAGDEETLCDLLRRAVGYFGDRVAAIRCSSSVPDFRRVFSRLGFARTGSYHPLMVYYDPDLREKLERVTDGWFLTAADHDIDQMNCLFMVD